MRTGRRQPSAARGQRQPPAAQGSPGAVWTRAGAQADRGEEAEPRQREQVEPIAALAAVGAAARRRAWAPLRARLTAARSQRRASSRRRMRPATASPANSRSSTRARKGDEREPRQAPRRVGSPPARRSNRGSDRRGVVVATYGQASAAHATSTRCHGNRNPERNAASDQSQCSDAGDQDQWRQLVADDHGQIADAADEERPARGERAGRTRFGTQPAVREQRGGARRGRSASHRPGRVRGAPHRKLGPERPAP